MRAQQSPSCPSKSTSTRLPTPIQDFHTAFLVGLASTPCPVLGVLVPTIVIVVPSTVRIIRIIIHIIILVPLPLLLATSLHTRGAAGQCTTAPYSQSICAEYIRPWTDNAYFWQYKCEITPPADTGALMAAQVEMWDYGYPWCVRPLRGLCARR